MITHGQCGKWWTGAERSHCGGCHETFSSLSAFEKHRRGLRCARPEQIGLQAREKPFGTLWGHPAPENRSWVIPVRQEAAGGGDG